MKPSHTIRPHFDDPNIVSCAGLVPALRLAESAGLYDLLGEVTTASPNPVVKAASVIGGMLAGADSIDDMDLLRHGGMGRLFAGVRAPSTLGTFLRTFTHGHVQQLDSANTRLLAGLAGRAPGLLGGGTDADGIAFIDIDDTIRQVHGYAKQAAAYGYSGVRGLNLQIAAVSSPTSAPLIVGTRLRKGNAASASGSGQLLARAVGASRRAGVRGQVMVRADSAYYCHKFVAAAVTQNAWFSVTARMNTAVARAIASIDEKAWQAITYPNAVFDEVENRWVSDAEVAEVPFTAFTSRKKADHIACRLVVRRVKRIQPLTNDAEQGAQGELFAAYRHHGFVTNSTLGTVEADQRHRDHAIIEQVIAELKGGALAHLPSGKYAANAAWAALAVIAFNLSRACAVAAGMATARWSSVRSRIVNVAGRVASTGRRLVLHLPVHWPWAQAWETLWDRATGPPAAV